MADAADLKSASLTGVWVQVPPSAPSPQSIWGSADYYGKIQIVDCCKYKSGTMGKVQASLMVASFLMWSINRKYILVRSSFLVE